MVQDHSLVHALILICNQPYVSMTTWLYTDCMGVKNIGYVLTLSGVLLSSMGCKSPEFDHAQGSRSFRVGVYLEDSSYTSANASVGDVNGDGHLDVVLVKGRHWPLQNLVRFGDGMGSFADAVAIGSGADRSYTGELIDLDADGDLDLIVSNDSPDPKRVLHNTGQGDFVEVQQFGEPQWNTRHIAVADLNNDGLFDVVAANRGGSEGTDSFVCFGTDGGLVAETCTAVYHGSATTITAADMDNDGDLDLIVPHRDGGQSEVRFNSGNGVFTSRTVFGPSSVGYRATAVDDFDDDGYVDIAVIAPGSSTGIETLGPDGGNGVIAAPRFGIFYGQSDGSFARLHPLTNESDRPYAILAEDVDGDGRKDLVVGFIGSHPIVWFNEGRRAFSSVAFGDDDGIAYGFAVADLDRDGFNDIVVARSEAPNVIYFGWAGH